jgi:hypothetical protein
MVQSLRETTRANEEKDWLKTNLARVSGLMQGHRDLRMVATLIMNELTPLVGAQHGTFYLSWPDGDDLLLRQAMLLDPLVGAVCTTDEVWQMVDDMLIAQKRWLPQYAAAIEAAERRPRVAEPRFPDYKGYRVPVKSVEEIAAERG